LPVKQPKKKKKGVGPDVNGSRGIHGWRQPRRPTLKAKKSKFGQPPNKKNQELCVGPPEGGKGEKAGHKEKNSTWAEAQAPGETSSGKGGV